MEAGWLFLCVGTQAGPRLSSGGRLRGGSTTGSSNSAASVVLLCMAAMLCLFAGGASLVGATRLWRAGAVVVKEPEPESGQKDEEKGPETVHGTCSSCGWNMGVRKGTGRLIRGSFTASIGIAEVVDVAAREKAAAVATASTPRLRRCASYDRAIAQHRPPRPVRMISSPAVAMAPPLPLPWPPLLPLPMRRCASLDDAAWWSNGSSSDCSGGGWGGEIRARRRDYGVKKKINKGPRCCTP